MSTGYAAKASVELDLSYWLSKEKLAIILATADLENETALLSIARNTVDATPYDNATYGTRTPIHAMTDEPKSVGVIHK